jgi:hypothetical protein
MQESTIYHLIGPAAGPDCDLDREGSLLRFMYAWFDGSIGPCDICYLTLMIHADRLLA